jgi:hypothetical protein
VDGSRTFLKSGAYRWIMRLLGLLLIAYAVMLFQAGVTSPGLRSQPTDSNNLSFRRPRHKTLQ